MQRLSRDRCLVYELDGRRLPAMTVEQDEPFVVETEDAGSGLVRSEAVLSIPEHRPTMLSTPARVNPVGGPIFVKGVAAGDLLAVRVEEIVVDAQGYSVIIPDEGGLADSHTWAELQRPYTRILRHTEGPSGTLRDGTVHFNDAISFPLRPFIGTIACAPEREVESTGEGQGPWGGNLDCRHFSVGSTIFLNTYHDGGLLHVGDVHASQGDTEFGGTANETRAEVHLRCGVVPRKRVPFVRVETPDSLVALSAARPLEDAVSGAIVHLMEWLVEEYGMERREAYLLMSVHPDLRVHVYQMVKIGKLRFVAGAELPRRYAEMASS